MAAQVPILRGGEIRITIVTGEKPEDASKVIRCQEIHNETLCTVTTHLDGQPVTTTGGDSEQHPYDTSPHAQEKQNDARSNLIGGSIIIEIHNETRLIENRYYNSGREGQGAGQANGEASKKRDASSLDVIPGEVNGEKAEQPARLAIEAPQSAPVPVPSETAASSEPVAEAVKAAPAKSNKRARAH